VNFTAREMDTDHDGISKTEFLAHTAKKFDGMKKTGGMVSMDDMATASPAATRRRPLTPRPAVQRATGEPSAGRHSSAAGPAVILVMAHDGWDSNAARRHAWRPLGCRVASGGPFVRNGEPYGDGNPHASRGGLQGMASQRREGPITIVCAASTSLPASAPAPILRPATTGKVATGWCR
jgi:hypothetical protein